ncbi:MAG: hypothetical protein ACK4IC_07550 [Erythrobacter sp.]
MIGRIAWLGGLLALALLTTFLQLDRQSETTPALAAMVPEPLRGYAQVPIADAAVKGGDRALGLAEARRLVRRRPVPAEHLTLLALAQTRAGDVEQAGLTVQIAAQRGWREPLAQEAVLRLALEAGDKPEAARRYTALFLRAATPDALLREVGPAVLEETGGPGQQTLVDIISATDRWNEMFLRRGVKVMSPPTFADITAATIERGVRYDCGVLTQTLKALGQADPNAASRVRTAAGGQCPDLGGESGFRAAG